jgi:PD-(D/E)XK nuclease superfamily
MAAVAAPSRPARTLADVLADLAGAGPGGDTEVVEALRHALQVAAGAAADVGGWGPGDPLRLTKRTVTWLLRCPVRAAAGEGEAAGDDLLIGYVVDAAAKVATLVPQRPPSVESALAFLTATGETAVDDRLAAGDAAGTRTLLAETATRVGALAAAWPAIEPAWWPRVEDPVRARLAGGRVTVGGRLDLVLGGPPTERPAVVVEVKAGRWYDGMRADGHLYALLLALRDGVAPRAAVTVVADGTTQIEPIRPAVLAHAAERLAEAMTVAAHLATGATPEARPNPGCPHCPARHQCPPGQAWRPDQPEAVPA